MASRIQGITIEIGGDTTKLSKALEGVNKDLKTAQSGLKDVDRLLKMDPGNVELLSQKQGYLNDAIEKTEERLKKEKEALQQLKDSDGFDKNSEQAKALQRQIEADEQALKGLKDEAKSFGSVAKQQFEQAGKSIQDFGGKMTDAGKGLSVGVTAPIMAIGGLSMAAFQEVDAGLDIVIQKTGATGEALEEMNGIVENIATTMPTSFEDAGTAVGEVSTRFGVTGQELEDLSKQFLQFAEINGTDVNSSIDTVQKALSAFGLGAEEAGSLLDTMNAVGQGTGISMDTLAAGLVTNATAFQEMGLGIEQAAAFMGQMEMSGADTSAVMGGLSKALKNATAEGVPLDDALAQLQDTIMNGSGEVDGLTAAYELFGKSGAQVFEAVRSGSLDFQNLAENATASGGTVAETFEAMQDPSDKMVMALNSAKLAGAELGGTIGEVLAPMIEKGTELIGSLTEKFRSLSPEQQEMIVKIGLIVAAAGPLLVVIGTVISAIGSVVGAIGLLFSPIGLVVAAIAGVIAIGVALYKNWDTIEEKLGGFADNVKEKFGEIKENIIGPVRTAKEKVEEFVDKIKGFFDFKWSLPHIDLPHFSISGSINPFDWFDQGVPRISVEWYRRAYDEPVLFTRPTVLQTAAGLKGFGDGYGAEIVMGLDRLRELVGANRTTNINVYGAQGQDVASLARKVERYLVQQNQREQAVFG